MWAGVWLEVRPILGVGLGLISVEHQSYHQIPPLINSTTWLSITDYVCYSMDPRNGLFVLIIFRERSFCQSSYYLILDLVPRLIKPCNVACARLAWRRQALKTMKSVSMCLFSVVARHLYKFLPGNNSGYTPGPSQRSRITVRFPGSLFRRMDTPWSSSLSQVIFPLATRH